MIPSEGASTFTTVEVARQLGLSVRSVQLMVDRGELDAWKTSGGHRRISGESVERWRAASKLSPPAADTALPGPTAVETQRPVALLIDDSVHFQKLVSLLIRQRFPTVDLHVADDGIAGLAMYGRLQPQLLIVDVLLPGIDGPTLISTLRSHPQFSNSRLVVVTSLDERELLPFAFALEGVPVIHKTQLVEDMTRLLAQWLMPAPVGASMALAGTQAVPAAG